MPEFKRLSVIIPVFNEEKTIAQIIDKVKKVGLPQGLEKEIVVIDDQSTDQTREVLSKIQGIRLICHQKNKGKGGAVKTGIHHTTGEIILLQDADLEYDPQDYPRLIQPLLDGRAEFVQGSRFIYGKPRFFTRDGAPFFNHYVGNKIIIGLTNLLYGQNKTDYEGCYKVFTRELAQTFTIQSNGFAFDNELICKALRSGYRLMEVPIRYYPRLYSEGKKITWMDGLQILWAVIKWRFLPFRHKRF